MFRSLTIDAEHNTAVPHLSSSQLSQAHAHRIEFSLDKPNVIVGPNGAGKSALITALSLATLTHYLPISSLSRKYVQDFNSSEIFWQKGTWRFDDLRFLPGLDFDGDFGPALFYRPHHIPGNDNSVTAAMMCGYSNEARAYGEATRHKSSGQGTSALLARMHDMLAGEFTPWYEMHDWGYGAKPINEKHFDANLRHRVNPMIERYTKQCGAMPIALMDEPEQSLDAMAQAKLWRAIESADTSKMQIIVASHSLYPALHPERFNLIESVPGYAKSIKEMLG